ncbi:MAG TPA: hypothetical protein VH142_02225 [Polyangiaceae bacterium]|nr:hypothetical protein [Polyangiaceae bacterium]
MLKRLHSNLAFSIALGASVAACGASADEAPPPNTAGPEFAPPPLPPTGAPSSEPPSAAPPVPGEPPAPPSTAPAPPPPAAAATPPAPPPVAAAPVDSRPVVTPADPSATGQWVYTTGYGWVWMPYDRAYTYVTPAEDDAYTYAYYPAYGWEWMRTPWIVGIGPEPYWGRVGPARFAWYVHPWFRTRGYYYGRPYYGRGYYGRGPRGGYYHRGFRR